MRTTFLVLSLFLSLSLASSARAQAPQPLELSAVPKEGRAPEDFVPKGWDIEATTRGDLDKNGREDVVLELVQSPPPGASEEVVADRARALVVLLSEEGGKLRRAGASSQVLYCTTCAGMMGGGGGVVKIQRGVLLVDQLRGSRETVSTLLRFRYEPKTGRFALIGKDAETRDRATGESTSVSTNLLTGQQVTEKRQYDLKKEKDVILSSKKQKVPVRKQYLEDVDIEQG